MKGYPNIDKSVFRDGYVGYDGEATWHIARFGKRATAWRASHPYSGEILYGRTLGEVSDKLEIRSKSAYATL